MDNLRHMVGDNPYWRPTWDGTFAPLALFFFILNIFFVLLGVSVAWNRERWQGITPLAIFMFYNLSNAFARTSGGRYIVPMDWIITIYFALGILQVVFWFVNTLGMDWKFDLAPDIQEMGKTRFTPTELSKFITVIIILVGFGALIPLSETLQLERYKNVDTNAILAENQQALTAAGLDTRSIDLFRQNDGATILVGRALYPRYYKKDKGEPFFYPTITLPFPRMTFQLIGPQGENGVILPGDLPTQFPHASDVLVIGCKSVDYFDALAVIMLDGSNSVYVRKPESTLQCPLQQPVCDNNSVCQ